jgi:hypothetical protein
MRGEISLDPALLENVKPRDDGSIIAACPVCRAAGSDKSGEHLKIEPSGKFGCATHPGDHAHRQAIFKLAGRRNGTSEKSNAAFNWQACLDAFTDEHAQRLGAWRGLSIEFVRWLHSQGIAGIFEGKTAFANHGDGGKVVSCHVRLDTGKWIFKPSGKKTAPLIFGNAKAVRYVLTFESQWDAFAVMDKLGWHVSNCLPDAAVFVTRGAGNGKLIHGQFLPDAICYCFTQNDTAAQTWLAEVTSNAGCKVFNVGVPTPHKDANDWTRAGATADDLQAAMKAAKPVQPAKTAPDSNRAAIAREYLGEESEPKQADLPPIVDAAEFLATTIEAPAELIAGILHKGSKLAVGGSSKAFKTWLLLDMGISVATGAEWLGRTTARGKMLFVNFEIQPHAWQRRIADVARAKGVELKPGTIQLWNLRGHAADFRALVPQIIERARREGFALIILDPLYKLYGGTDENAAGDVAALLNSLERLAVDTGAAVAYGCHFAKGNAATKEALDRISGSGVFARDPDSLLIFTKHEEADAFTVEPILRNFAPVEPFCVRWQFPLMQPDKELDPAKLKQVAGRKPENAPDDLLKVLPADGLTNADFLDAAKEQGISERSYYRLKKELETAGKIMLSKVTGKWTPILTKKTP